MKVFRKLIRDNIPEIMAQDGVMIKTRVLNEGEFLQALENKLLEEVQEMRSAEKDKKEEIADIYEVLDALLDANKFSKEDIFRMQKDKREKRGGFTKRLFLESSA